VTADPQAPPVYRLVVEDPTGDGIVGVNQASIHRIHTWKETQREWRDAAFWLAKATRMPRLERAELRMVCHLRNWRQADGPNMASGPSLKGLVDGLVLAGVVRDDRLPWLDVLMPRLAGLDGGRPRVDVELQAKGSA
jgi:hypothetical protein